VSAGLWNFAIEEAVPGRAFVGIVRRPDGALALRLPLNYPSETDATGVKVLGDLTRVLARFATAHPSEQESTGQCDGFLENEDGLGHRELSQPQSTYSRISDYLNLLRRLRAVDLSTMRRLPGMASFDPRYISRNLDRATYLPDGTPVFELMWAQSSQMRRLHNGWMHLASWMALDAVTHLFPAIAGNELNGSLLVEWELLSRQFTEDYGLAGDASLFSAQAAVTLPQLRDVFDVVDRADPPISGSMRELRHLIDRLLHCSLSNDHGEVWGIKGFYRVWEAACLETALAHYGAANIFTCDDGLMPNVAPSFRKQWRDNGNRVFARNGIERRPDLVVHNGDGTFVIVDFKYSTGFADEQFYVRRPRPPKLADVKNAADLVRTADQLKAWQDIASLEAYRWLMMQHELHSADEDAIKLEIWAPAMQASRRACKWGIRGRDSETSRFNGLEIVHQPIREILGSYGEKFSVFD
jgi:hypothetical protein